MEQEVGLSSSNLSAPVVCSYDEDLTISTSEGLVVNVEPQINLTSSILYEPKFELFVKGGQDSNQFSTLKTATKELDLIPVENQKATTIWINQLTRGIISAGNLTPLLKLTLDSCSVGNLTIIHSGRVLDFYKPYANIVDTQNDNTIQFDFLPVMPAGLENTNGKDIRLSFLIDNFFSNDRLPRQTRF